MTKSVIKIAYPMLPTADIKKSVDFYTTQLGFEVVFQSKDEYASVQRDTVVIDLWKCTNPAMKGNEPGCRLIVENIEELFKEYKAKITHVGIHGPRPALTELEIKPWGMKEFSVLDPDNNALHIGERVE